MTRRVGRPSGRARLATGSSNATVRHRIPSAVITCASRPSSRMVTRPASGTPTPTMPTALTLRSTSTGTPASSLPGSRRDGGGPAGLAPARRSRATSRSLSRDGTLLRSTQNVMPSPARCGPIQNCCRPIERFPPGGTARLELDRPGHRRRRLSNGCRLGRRLGRGRFGADQPWWHPQRQPLPWWCRGPLPLLHNSQLQEHQPGPLPLRDIARKDAPGRQRHPSSGASV